MDPILVFGFGVLGVILIAWILDFVRDLMWRRRNRKQGLESSDEHAAIQLATPRTRLRSRFTREVKPVLRTLSEGRHEQPLQRYRDRDEIS